MQQEASRVGDMNVSESLLDASIVAANQALADRCHFMLRNEQWTTFQRMLNRPKPAKSRLKKLLNEPISLG